MQEVFQNKVIYKRQFPKDVVRIVICNNVCVFIQTFYYMEQSTDFVLKDTGFARKRSTMSTKFEMYFTGKKSSLSLLLIAMTVA